MTDAPLPTTAEEEAALLEQTDNGPRPEDGDQPPHIPAHGVEVDEDGTGIQVDIHDDEDLVDVTDFEADDEPGGAT